jgi:predicted DNA-binding transcriptional regulator AlpA
MDTPTTDPLIPSAQVRREFGISRTTLWRWERDGILPRAHRIKNQRFFPRSALDALRAAAAKPGGVSVDQAGAA